MDFWLSKWNDRGVESESKGARLTHDIQLLRLNICCIQETHLITGDYEGVLSMEFRLSRYFYNRSKGVFWLVSKSFFGRNLSTRLWRSCVLDVTIKEKAFQLIEVYAPNDWGMGCLISADRSVCDILETGSFCGWLERYPWSHLFARKSTNIPSDIKTTFVGLSPDSIWSINSEMNNRNEYMDLDI